ncbi:MAG: right-handed parallel beta-helix repeat-containing protein [Kiritimatiellae bacterium]|nr:right-handed parallel beta-helix repeat-containing protein [Kiritimatiellia bacterium]
MKTILCAATMGMMALGASAGSMTIYNERGDEIWCESQYAAMFTLKEESGDWGNGPVTIRLDEDLALSETFDFSWIDRDITLDLNGNTLMSDEGADWFSDELLNIELQNDQNGHSFTLQDGSVTGAKTKGAIRIAAGQHVTIKNVTFESNRCDGNLADLWEGDVGGAIRCNSNLKLVGCTFRNNSCTTHGGAVGIYNGDYQSRFVIENCTFEGNTAVEAGGALFLGCSGRIQNTTISGNTVTGREDGATEGQNETTAGQGGGVYLTRHGGVAFGDEDEGFWWGRFEGPTLQIEEGVQIVDNTASLKPGTAVYTNNLYLSRNWNSFNNAAVMVSGDTRAETSWVGLTLSNEIDVFSRTLNEEGGEWLTDDFSSWFFSDAKTYLVPVLDSDEGALRLEPHLPPGEPQVITAETAEEAVAAAAELFVFAPSEEVAAVLDELDEEAAEDYSKMFAPVATPVAGETGSWSVSFVLTPEATNVIQEAMSEAPAQILSSMTAGATEVEDMDVIPGFYYAVSYGSTPGLGANSEGALATGKKMTLGLPTVKGKSAFFRVMASERPILPVAEPPQGGGAQQ